MTSLQSMRLWKDVTIAIVIQVVILAFCLKSDVYSELNDLTTVSLHNSAVVDLVRANGFGRTSILYTDGQLTQSNLGDDAYSLSGALKLNGVDSYGLPFRWFTVTNRMSLPCVTVLGQLHKRSGETASRPVVIDYPIEFSSKSISVNAVTFCVNALFTVVMLRLVQHLFCVIRRRIRQRQHRCQVCGYCIETLRRCPECGQGAEGAWHRSSDRGIERAQWSR